jgi:hypothetical protein
VKNKIIKLILSIILIYSHFISFSQSFTENSLKQIAKETNKELKGIDIGNGITFRSCNAFKRTIFYQYDVNEYWYLAKNIKEVLIENFKTAGYADVFFKNNINAEFQYYYGNKLLKRISIKSNEFSDLNFNLGKYKSINGHPKAKDVNMKIKSPVGWEVKEGNYPNVVTIFVYKTNSYTISVKDNFTFLSRNEVRELFANKEYVNDIITATTSSFINPIVINHRIVTINTYPTLEYTVSASVERSGVKLKTIMKYWMIYYEDKIVFLQFMSFDRKTFDALERLCNSITNSIIFPEQYN